MDKKKFSFTEQEEVDFIESLYNSCGEELKKIYSLHKENKDKLLKEIAFIMLQYNISNNVMELDYTDKVALKDKLSKLIDSSYRKQENLTKAVITGILLSTVKSTWNFYGYKDYKKEDVEKVVNKKYKGKLFTTRIKNNENAISTYLYSKVSDFIDGKVDVNTINDDIQKTYKTNRDNVVTLGETELNRSENDAFIIYARSIGITKVVRNEVLDGRTCDECESIHGEVFNLEDAPDEIHPRCRGFNSPYSDGVED
jgi:hypothetical protein